MKILIGIPTYKRPHGLKRLLDSLVMQEKNYCFDVLIANNDAESPVSLEGRDTDFRELISVLDVAERGISPVRNAILKYAFTDGSYDLLLMVDDDEIVDSGWLSAMVSMQQATGADAVVGSVLPLFEVGAPEWTKGNSLYWRNDVKDGLIDMIYGTTNVLISKSVYEKWPGHSFRNEFKLTGGGDYEFFFSLKKMGAIFAGASSAITYEVFGESRLTLDWCYERAQRIGAAEAKVALIHGYAFKLTLKAFAKYLYELVMGGRNVRSNIERRKQLGRMRGVFMKSKEVYKTVHGG